MKSESKRKKDRYQNCRVHNAKFEVNFIRNEYLSFYFSCERNLIPEMSVKVTQILLKISQSSIA